MVRRKERHDVMLCKQCSISTAAKKKKLKMNKGRRGHAPMRTRRRQSDAKWRASVASCYETLKFVIPNRDALPKRKTSKALVLQETEKHIMELEQAISHVLNIEAEEQEVGVLWRKGHHWAPATLEDIRQDFSEKQRQIFNQKSCIHSGSFMACMSETGQSPVEHVVCDGCHQSSQGRRCYNLLHDIQDEILSMSAQSSSLAFVHLQDNEDGRLTKDAGTCSGRRRHKVARNRCRHAERAFPRVLSVHKTGELVKAVVPTGRGGNCRRQLSNCPRIKAKCRCAKAALRASQGVEMNLMKVGNIYIPTDISEKECTPEKASFEQQQEGPQLQSTVQEVPGMLTPCKPYGIARNDVMMSADQCEGADIFNSALHGYSTPLSGRQLGVDELESSMSHTSQLSRVCKKLDFSIPLLETQGTADSDASLQFPHSSTFMSATTVASMNTMPAHGTAESVGYRCHTSPGPAVSDGANGFTPVKLPVDACVPVSPLLSPNPAWSLGATMDARVPQAGLNDFDEADIEGARNLLCMENDLDDVNGKSTNKPRTPAKPSCVYKRKMHHECSCKRKGTGHHPNRKNEVHGRPRPKCRKRLEDLYVKSSWKVESEDAAMDPMQAGMMVNPTVELCDFEGYLLYYRQVAPNLKEQLGSSHDAQMVAAIVSEMWTKLPSDDRHTMVTLAALENQDSNSSGSGSLSQDLEELDIKPLNGGLYEGICHSVITSHRISNETFTDTV